MFNITLIGQSVVDYLISCGDHSITNVCLEPNCFNKLPTEQIKKILAMSTVRYRSAGGCATNTAFGLSNLGRSVTLLCSVGADEEGEYYKSQISKAQLVHPYFQTRDASTGLVVTLLGDVDLNVPRTNMYNHGCSNRILLDDYLARLLSETDVLYATTFSFFDENSDNLFEILECASRRSEIIVDAGGSAAIPPEKIARVFQYACGIIMNEHDKPIIEKKLDMIVDELSFHKWIVVTRGRKETEFYRNGYKQFEKSTYRVEVVGNMIGAGDAFSAGFLSSYVAFKDFERAIDTGNRYAMNIVSRQAFH